MNNIARTESFRVSLSLLNANQWTIFKSLLHFSRLCSVFTLFPTICQPPTGRNVWNSAKSTSVTKTRKTEWRGTKCYLLEDRDCAAPHSPPPSLLSWSNYRSSGDRRLPYMRSDPRETTWGIAFQSISRRLITFRRFEAKREDDDVQIWRESRSAF